MSIAREGFPFILIPLALGCILIFVLRGIWLWPGSLLLIIALFSAYFFRDPPRVIPQAGNLYISPADGTVLELADENGMQSVRIFLSVFNVHLQRAPAAGKVISVEYRPGKFMPAMRPKAHQDNEQNIITLECGGARVVVKQIAGLIARRIVSYVKPGDTVAAGQHIGLIRFGSQVDLILPKDVQIKVAVGQKVVGGETIIAEKK